MAYPTDTQYPMPIVPAMTQVPSFVPTYATVLPAGSPEVPAVPGTTLPQVPPPEDATRAAQKRLLKWGTIGVLLGAGANTIVTALAFKSFQKNQSVWKPALWAGAGSVVIGGTLLWILAQSMSQDLDQRIVAATIGAKLAV